MERYEYYISETRAGGTVRPRNWIDRVAILAASFDRSKRLRYNEALVPTTYRGKACLRIDKEMLHVEWPEMYDCVMNIIASLDAKKLDVS